MIFNLTLIENINTKILIRVEMEISNHIILSQDKNKLIKNSMKKVDREIIIITITITKKRKIKEKKKRIFTIMILMIDITEIDKNIINRNKTNTKIINKLNMALKNISKKNNN